jgi:hypothetical protein
MAGKFKAMSLVEEAELERLRQRQIREYDPSLNNLAKIQENILKLFEAPDMSDEVKYKILVSLQERFATLYNRFKNSTPYAAPTPPTMTEDVPPQAIVEQPAAPEQAAPAVEPVQVPDVQKQARPGLLQFENFNIPSQYHQKLDTLQKFIQDHQDVISTNHKGELVLDGTPFQNSSFSDLIRGLYIRNQSMNLNGMSNLIGKLYQLNAPKALLSHKDAVGVYDYFTKKPPAQTGKGKAKRKSSAPALSPPGKAPRILHVFRM